MGRPHPGAARSGAQRDGLPASAYPGPSAQCLQLQLSEAGVQGKSAFPQRTAAPPGPAACLPGAVHEQIDNIGRGAGYTDPAREHRRRVRHLSRRTRLS